MEENTEDKLISELYEYECEIYAMCIYVAIGMDDDTCQGYFSNEIEKFSEDDPYYAYTVKVNRKGNSEETYGVLIRFRSIDDSTNDVIAHEASHAAFEILERIGFNLDYDNQEPYSYLLQWIFTKVEEARDDYLMINNIEFIK